MSKNTATTFRIHDRVQHKVTQDVGYVWPTDTEYPGLVLIDWDNGARSWENADLVTAVGADPGLAAYAATQGITTLVQLLEQAEAEGIAPDELVWKLTQELRDQRLNIPEGFTRNEKGDSPIRKEVLFRNYMGPTFDRHTHNVNAGWNAKDGIWYAIDFDNSADLTRDDVEGLRDDLTLLLESTASAAKTNTRKAD